MHNCGRKERKKEPYLRVMQREWWYHFPKVHLNSGLEAIFAFSDKFVGFEKNSI